MRSVVSSVLAAVAAMAIGSAASAATLRESDLPGGFSGLFNRPTEVSAGFATIEGTGSQNIYDNFVFTGLPGGAQSLSFHFAAPEGHGYSYSAGATILYADQPFRWGWDGARVAEVQVGHWTPTQDLRLDLGDGFAGKLYLALNFTHGDALAYTISAPSNASPVVAAPVPLPPTALLLAAGVAALGGFGLRRRRA